MSPGCFLRITALLTLTPQLALTLRKDMNHEQEPPKLNQTLGKRKREEEDMDQSEENSQDDGEDLEWREIYCPHCKGCVKYLLKCDNHAHNWVSLLMQILIIMSVWLQSELT